MKIEKTFSNNQKIFLSFVLSVTTPVILLADNVSADKLNEMFSKVTKFVNTQEYPKALEELQWIEKELESKHLKQLSSLIPEKIINMTGGKVESKNVMGMIEITRPYQEANKQVVIAIQGGGGSANPLNSIMKMGQMAAIMGNGVPGQESLRIDGRTGTLNAIEGQTKKDITLFLEGGYMLRFETDSLEVNELKKIAENFPTDKIEKYLKS
jgi:hypothetical protein